MTKYKSACSSLRGGQLNRIMKNFKDTRVKHGVTCFKVDHVKTGYLHAENDDTTYTVDGCVYCGRCHAAV